MSHSHRDLEKVRQIRNELERRGHNPLLFFLKCLGEDDARLPELIRDEIRAARVVHPLREGTPNQPGKRA